MCWAMGAASSRSLVLAVDGGSKSKFPYEPLGTAAEVSEGLLEGTGDVMESENEVPGSFADVEDIFPSICPSSL